MPHQSAPSSHRHKGRVGGDVKTGQRGPTKDLPSPSTAAWPGLPGPTQPRNRSGGTKKVTQHAKSEGI